MALPAQTTEKRLSPEAYFAFAARQEGRYEYEHGELVDMGLTESPHSELMINLSSALKQAVKGRPCKVFAETVGLEVEANGRYYLPDVMLSCDERDLRPSKIKHHPSLVVEILSPGTADRDRGTKFEAYLRLPSLRYYVLVAQDKIRVEVFHKLEKGWKFDYYESLENEIDLADLEVRLNLSDLYDGVQLLSPEAGEDDETGKKA